VRSKASLLLVLGIPIVLAVLFSMDFAPQRHLVTYRPDRFAPWGPPADEPSFNADCLRSYYPRRVLATEALRSGRIPLWDPHSFCGQPFLANFQSGVFYPVNLALLPFTPERQMGLFVWVHLLIAAWGMAAFLRGCGLSREASLIGGLLFAVSASLAVRTGQSTMLATPAWIPVVLHLARRTVRGGSIVPLALAYGCMILAGFPPILVWCSLLAGAWTVYQWWAGRDRWGVGTLVRAGGGFILGAAFAAVQLVPTAELAAHSDRIRFTYETLVSSSWHPAALARMLVPDFFGSPFDRDLWIHQLKRGDGHYMQSFLSTAGYVGIGTLLFLAAGLGRAWRDRSGRFLLVAMVVAALILLGTPLLRAVSVLPVIGGARIDRIVHIVVFGIVTAAAFGFDRWRGGEGRRAGIVGALIIAAIVAALVGWREGIAGALGGTVMGRPLPAGPMTGRALHVAVFVVGAAALFFLPPRWRTKAPLLLLAGAILVLDPALVARRCHVTVSAKDLPVPTDETALLQELSKEGRIVRYQDLILPPNLPALFGIEDVAGYNALNIKEYRSFYREIAPLSVKERRINPLAEAGLLGDERLDQLSARWIVTKRPLPEERYPLVHDGAFRIYERTSASPRAFLFDQPSYSSRMQDQTLPGTPGEGSARIVLHEPERVLIECETPRRGALVLTDTNFPGWRVSVDGERAEIKPFGVFRSVWVEPGTHRVEFRYEPASFRIGAALSIGSLALAAFLALRAIRLRRGGQNG